MPAFLMDTSCIIAMLCTWHEHHTRAITAVEERLEAGEALVAAAPALVESYAVLTRLPAPYRLAGSYALALLDANFGGGQAQIIALTGDDYWQLVRTAPGLAISGGRTYDAVIAACARVAAVTALLTFNDAHFHGLVGPEITIVVP